MDSTEDKEYPESVCTDEACIDLNMKDLLETVEMQTEKERKIE